MKYCKVCDQPIPASRKSNNVKYCSLKCARYAEHRQNIKNITKRANKILPIAQKVYHAYGHKCAICGWQATPELIKIKGRLQYSHGNAIHHIIPTSEGGEETALNLILLCPNHHKQADMELIARSELRKHLKSIELSDKQKRIAAFKVADALSELVFGDS